MLSFRCLITNIQNKLLSEVIRHTTKRNPAIEIVNNTHAHEELPVVVKDHDIDLVIMGVEEEFSQKFNALFEAYPKVVAVALVNDGQRICVCIEDVGPDEFMSLVQTVMKHRRDGTSPSE